MKKATSGPIRSMTGFGRAHASGERITAEVEIKSWNHKGYDAQLRLPDAYAHLEAGRREQLASRAGRGKVTVALRLRGEVPGREILLHESLIRSVFEPYRRVAESLGFTPQLSAGDVAQIPGALEVVETAAGPVEIIIVSAFTEALESWDRSRLVEGERLADAIREQVERLTEAAALIRIRNTVAPAERAARLRGRVHELMEHMEASVEEKRLELEIALLAERSDVQEEIIRLESHLATLRKLIGAPRSQTADALGIAPAPVSAIGAEIGFLLQELLRETNTTGSKSPDLETIKAVISAKTAIDRIKEIAANVV